MNININIDAPQNFAKTIILVGHLRETRPCLRNHHGNSSDDPKAMRLHSNATKIDTVLPLESPTKHLTITPTTVYHHAWVACCFVTPELSPDWLLHRPIRSLLQMLQDKKRLDEMLDKISSGGEATDATMLKNFHDDVE